MSYRTANLALVPAVTEDPADRRVDERLTVSALSWLNRVRLKYGPTVSLIDLSSGGAQIETDSYRLQPGTNVVIEIAGDDGDFVLPSRVLRCSIAGIAPHPTYRGALAFKRRLDLPDSPRAPRSAAPADANPLHEHARLAAALRRLSGPHAGSDTLTSVGSAALSAALALIDSPSRRHIGTPFAREATLLIREVAHAIENDTDPDKLVTIIAERLRRSMPARAIRVVDADFPLRRQHPEPIAFDVPSAPGKPMKLVVEFPSGMRLDEWHFNLLRTAAHLVTLTTEVEQARKVAQERTRMDAQRVQMQHGWHRLVVRYSDGRMLKGFGRDFMPTKGYVHVWSVPEGPAESRISVPLARLKAVFFVHDLDGGKTDVPVQSSILAGRRIVVTFFDGELLEGTTLNYAAEGPGFFVTPADEKSNNHRVFVVNGAVQHVQFP